MKTKISLPPEKIPAASTPWQKHFADAAADRLDGLRLDWPGRWLLVRGSNTEPIVRAIAEAPRRPRPAGCCEAAAEVLSAEVDQCIVQRANRPTSLSARGGTCEH